MGRRRDSPARISFNLTIASTHFRRARLGIARTWQSPRLFSSLSILDNLLISDRSYPGESLFDNIFRARKVASAERAARAQAAELLERVGLTQRVSALFTRLSYGQQKLVGLARALMNNGQCLLLDEPMAGVEGRVHDTMKSIIRQEAAAGKAVCIVEHNVGFIRDLNPARKSTASIAAKALSNSALLLILIALIVVAVA